ncbi:MAG: L-2-hydroxyglutarate oxidase [Chlamydiae bacterium CG10_big_fil_rev_8_21_14_0_10_35_9]|nr:MAG: L-2-hydroxyglutarate oxidase [Chlamydiae bacterium CG10_big_fil_rev_8_21_14_0_10_35_9]
MKSDVLIIGAGIVGLATAYQILNKNPGLTVHILDKECKAALHQTSRNSGVIHSGIYYKPGSLKAKNCLEGKKAILSFCEQKNIPFRKVGKIIVATQKNELPLLEDLYQRGVANGLSIEKIGPEKIKEIEPHAHALEAIWVPECSIVSYAKIASNLCEDLKEKDAEFFFNSKVVSITHDNDLVRVVTHKEEFTTKQLINCAGLYSDSLVPKKFRKDFQIIPFRGEYFELESSRKNLVKGLIYPVKDPRFPFLGVHLTRMINGKVEAGPNAVLAMAREAYKKTDFNLNEFIQTLSFPGFWKMAFNYWNIGLYEMYRSFSKQAFVKDLQKLIPEITKNDLVPAKSGIRAQVVLKSGQLPDDFIFINEKNILHVVNAPSPAATASFAIGKHLANLVFP